MKVKHTPVLYILIGMLFISISSFSQTLPVSEAEIQSELNKRGLDEEEVRQAISSAGFDPDNLQDLSPSEIVELEAIINGLEASKKNAKTKDADSDSGQGTTTIQEIKKVDQIQDTLIAEVEEAFNDEIEEDLPPSQIYGQEIFRNKTIKVYQQSEEVKAPEYYVLGPGDEIGISIWGRSQTDKEFTISKDGYIRITDGAQRIQLKGLTFAQARQKLKRAFASSYRFDEGEFEITLNYSRTVQVSVYGDVINPGPIHIPAVNTAFSALVAVKGPNDIGSVRNIELLKNSGERKRIDIYEYMNNPSVAENFYLEDNDIIVVPVAEKVVTIGGAVNRPLKYELLDNENLFSLVNYCGGFKQNALTTRIQVKRTDGDTPKIIDVFYDDQRKQNRDFKLRNGDVIIVGKVEGDVQNFVNIQGELNYPGVFERTRGMKLTDLLRMAELKPESKTDKAYLQRRNADQTTSFISLNLDKAIEDKNSAFNVELQNEDVIIVWPKSRFVDNATISIDGAVRYPEEFKFDRDQNVRLSDLIILAGGLRRDASNRAIIKRTDPLKPKETIYIRVENIRDIVENEQSAKNLVLSPFDHLIVYSENAFIEESEISVMGAVTRPGSFQYGRNMELKDALLLAGGFKIGAAKNKVELSRIVIKDNQPTKSIIANLELDKDYNIIESDNPNFSLEPYDAVLVRYVPDFEMQRFVELNGEVNYPGVYPIISKNEKITSIIARAGGLTDEGFAEGSTLFRSADGVGNVVIKLDEILSDRNSRFNFEVREGDVITIPKKKEFVTIKGATRVSEVLSDRAIGSNNEINVPYHKGKNALFYINEYAGGIAENGKKNLIFVEHPNGEIKKTKRVLFFANYPDVRKGSVINVGRKTVKEKKEEKEKEPVDWTKVLNDSVAQAMSILTLLVLINQID